jgi:hypothetical protein
MKIGFAQLRLKRAPSSLKIPSRLFERRGGAGGIFAPV